MNLKNNNSRLTEIKTETGTIGISRNLNVTSIRALIASLNTPSLCMMNANKLNVNLVPFLTGMMVLDGFNWCLKQKKIKATKITNETNRSKKLSSLK